ncbi:MAG: valine--tRNA ligase, partial [Spirochaetales bacterium]|nr:valine--tRNA ligase [Spirochaetales bacterium]
MEATAMAKAFNPADFEKRIYARWRESGAFSPQPGEQEKFVIVIPPPNVTGVLHMGHGLNNVLQDLLIRYHRMCGRRALWLPGTDHAGIATQNVVEKRLKARGLSRRELGREKFLEETWKVKNEHHDRIVEQLMRLGASCDWSRERFTMDEAYSRAVREVFVALYKRKLIYRGEYLINWCSSCGTALADDEVDHIEIPGKMYHYYYPFADGPGKMEIATTRPETMLGDTALAVNPEDERYRDCVGRKVILPLTGREIPVVADSFVDKSFGTGVVKITPAHDPNDYELSRRHGLPVINILNDNGTLNDNCPPPYRGLEVLAAREAVLRDLKAQGWFIREEEHKHPVGHCYRCKTIIEPYLSNQWFVSMKSLAEKALKAWEEGGVVFYPAKWENTYKHWLSTIRDWCISRQLWWGHRIPVWYCQSCGEMVVEKTDPDSCPRCGGELRQDEDVLDTWFSSWLWPFATLGWPENTRDMKDFFPTSTLVTGYDIIFFWVARMVMASEEFLGVPPFKDIYITGLVRDKQGRKMSKTLGNGMDPLEIVEEYGADALKFTLCFMSAQGQDILIDKESFKLGSKFANKIWNASRFILMNLEGRTLKAPEELSLSPEDRWILGRLNETIGRVRQAMTAYRFNEAAAAGYDFFWGDYCDWYLEICKLLLAGGTGEEKDRSASLLVYILQESLKILHPFLSFITEEIYGWLPRLSGTGEAGGLLINASFPEVRRDREAPEDSGRFAALQELIREVRTLRSEFAIPPEKRIPLTVVTDPGFAGEDYFRQSAGLIGELTRSQPPRFLSQEGGTPAPGAVAAAGNGFEAHVFIRDFVDIPREIQ